VTIERELTLHRGGGKGDVLAVSSFVVTTLPQDRSLPYGDENVCAALVDALVVPPSSWILT
jgi:hypothetical protein